MLRVNLDRSDTTELHAQVAAEIRRAVAKGEAKLGERLPPARDLAAVLGVNRNTVLRALRDLRDEGIVTFKRGRGATVRAAPEQVAVIEHARELVVLGRRHGYRIEELVELVQSAAVKG